MAKNPTGSGADRPTHPLLEKLGEMRATAEGLFVYSVKIVCGKQTETNCCCVAGVRPGLYATEVNIQNLNIEPAQVTKFVQPLISLGAVVAQLELSVSAVYTASPLSGDGISIDVEYIASRLLVLPGRG